MVSILHNTTFVIIYVIVAAACLMTLAVLDIKRIRTVKRNTEAVKENNRLYNELLEEKIRQREVVESYKKELESHKTAVEENTAAHERLM